MKRKYKPTKDEIKIVERIYARFSLYKKLKEEWWDTPLKMLNGMTPREYKKFEAKSFWGKIKKS